MVLARSVATGIWSGKGQFMSIKVGNREANWPYYLTSITTSASNFCVSLIMYSEYSEKRQDISYQVSCLLNLTVIVIKS